VARYDAVTRLAGAALVVGGGGGAAVVALPPIFSVPITGLAVVIAVRWWRVAVLADERHLTVRNVARTFVVPWHEVDGYDRWDDRLELNISGRSQPVFMEATKQSSLRNPRRRRRVQAILDRLVEYARAADQHTS
jgi:hypothetical protein